MLRGEGDFQDALPTTPRGSSIDFPLAVSPVRAQTTSLCNEVSVLPVPDAGGEGKIRGASIASYLRKCFITGHTHITGRLGNRGASWVEQSEAGCMRVIQGMGHLAS